MTKLDYILLKNLKFFFFFYQHFVMVQLRMKYISKIEIHEVWIKNWFEYILQ